MYAVSPFLSILKWVFPRYRKFMKHGVSEIFYEHS